MTTVRESVRERLVPMVPAPAARSILTTLPAEAADAELGSLDLLTVRELLKQLEAGLKVFGKVSPQALLDLKAGILGNRVPAPTSQRISVTSDAGVLMAQRACHAMVRGFFSATDSVRLVTVVSELARNIYQYAKVGELKLQLKPDGAGSVVFTIEATDEGPGIADIADVLSTSYVSKTGLGKGLKGAKAMLEEFTISSAPGKGTRITGKRRARW